MNPDRQPTLGLRRIALLVAVLLTGCTDAVGDLASLQAGRTAFSEACSLCHTSGDGFDLAYFGYPDEAIMRYALTFVREDRARDILGHIRSIDVTPVTPETRAFQPGGRLLDHDLAFAENLFGADEWPLDLTDEELAAIDPRDVPVAIPFPLWSDQASDTDWMPSSHLPGALLSFDPPSLLMNPARTYLDRYYADRRPEDLVSALTSLRLAVTRAVNHDGVCRLEEPEVVTTEVRNVTACFEALRWIATLGGQHVLREGAAILPEVHRSWWDVGFALSPLPDTSSAVGGLTQNLLAWTWLAWTFAPGDERAGSAIKFMGRVAASGLPRHETFKALRSMVDRPPGGVTAYHDLRTAAERAPASWRYAVVRLAYQHLISRLEARDYPYDLGSATNGINAAIVAAVSDVTNAELDELYDLRNRLYALLYQDAMSQMRTDRIASLSPARTP